MMHVADLIKPADFSLGKELIKKKMYGQISSVDFFKEATYFALMCGFDELIPHPLPTRPQKMLDYDRLTKEQKETLEKKPEFWLQAEIKAYLDSKIMILWQNRNTLQWLRTLEKRLEHYSDLPNREKVRQRINMFKDYYLYDEDSNTYRKPTYTYNQ